MAEQKSIFNDDDWDDSPAQPAAPEAAALADSFEDEPFDSPSEESLNNGEDAEDFTAPPISEVLRPPPTLACPPKGNETMKKAVNPHKSTTTVATSTVPAKRGRPKGTGGQGMIRPPSAASIARNKRKAELAAGAPRKPRGRPPKAAQPATVATEVTSTPVATPQPVVKTRKRRTKVTTSNRSTLNIDLFTKTIGKAIEKQTKPIENKLARVKILLKRVMDILEG